MTDPHTHAHSTLQAWSTDPTGTLRWDPAATDRLHAWGLRSVDDALALPAERRSRFKSLARLEHDQVFLKRWRFPRLEIAIRGALKANPPVFSGPTEALNLLALAHTGLRVPRPLACGTVDRGRERLSFVALERLPGTPLSHTLPDDLPALAHALGTLTRTLHRAGFWHRDLYLDNLFLHPHHPLGLLDCERVRWSPRGPRTRWRVKDLAALDYSTPSHVSTRLRLRALRAYLDRPLTSADRPLLRAIRRKARALARKGAKQ